MQSLLTALAFLSILPVRFRETPSADAVARARLWFPVVGLLLGGVLGSWTALVAIFTSPMLGAFLVLLVWVGLTGVLHLDGLCDLCDGLFGGHTPEDRLRIMKDPNLGTFGLVGGMLMMLGKFVLLYEILRRSPMEAAWQVGTAVLVVRRWVLSLAAGARYPRPEGTGKIIIEATRASGKGSSPR